MKKQLQELFRYSLSEESAERMFHSGRIGQQTYESYCHVCRWLAPRITGRTGDHQWAFIQQFGLVKFYARINKVRKAFGFHPLSNTDWTFRNVTAMRLTAAEIERTP